MATTPKKLYAGTPGTTLTTLYTAPVSTKTIIKSLVIGNTTGVKSSITINFAGIGLINSYNVEPNDTVVIDLSLVLEAGETITSLQETVTSLNVHISGVEVS